MIGNDLIQMIIFFVTVGLCSSVLIIVAIAALSAVIRSILNLMGRG